MNVILIVAIIVFLATTAATEAVDYIVTIDDN